MLYVKQDNSNEVYINCKVDAFKYRCTNNNEELGHAIITVILENGRTMQFQGNPRNIRKLIYEINKHNKDLEGNFTFVFDCPERINTRVY